MELPVALERRFGLYGKRLVSQACEKGMAAVHYDWTVLSMMRKDEDDEDLDETDLERESSRGAAILLAAMAALGVSLDTLLDEVRLRNVLRRVARSNDLSVKMQLAAALGRPVNVDASAEIDVWVENQVERIQALVSKWYDEAAVSIQTAPEDLDFEAVTLELAQKKSRAERGAFLAASAGLLLLNASLTAANATGVGINTYIWRAVLDDRVREHHADLDGTVQSFDSPPAGGGTTEADIGNPGDGINCRCVAEVIVT